MPRACRAGGFDATTANGVQAGRQAGKRQEEADGQVRQWEGEWYVVSGRVVTLRGWCMAGGEGILIGREYRPWTTGFDCRL